MPEIWIFLQFIINSGMSYSNHPEVEYFLYIDILNKLINHIGLSQSLGSVFKIPDLWALGASKQYIFFSLNEKYHALHDPCSS